MQGSEGMDVVSNPFSHGDKVRIRKGAKILTTHPSGRVRFARRSQIVTVNHTLGDDTIAWPGTGGYWCDVHVSDVERIEPTP
jgi:hypothetical protein